jgi:hypothetical protein
MAKISAAFSQLPEKTDPNWPGVYETVYAQLTTMGLEVPSTPANEISRDKLESHLQKLAAKLLRAEFKKTDKPNYSGMTDDEQWTRFHKQEASEPPPICSALAGLPYAPNAIDIADVTNCKKNGD